MPYYSAQGIVRQSEVARGSHWERGILDKCEFAMTRKPSVKIRIDIENENGEEEPRVGKKKNQIMTVWIEQEEKGSHLKKTISVPMTFFSVTDLFCRQNL